MEIKYLSYLTERYQEKSMGLAPNGEAVHAFELRNKTGLQLQVMNYGATITSLKIEKPNGKMVDVVLGFDSLDAYVKSFDLESPPYFGATIGRFAGRINNASFTLDGSSYQLNPNNGKHLLHGGVEGFSQKVWQVRRINFYQNPSITLTNTSDANEGGFPGKLSVELTYTLTDENELIIDYKATTDQDTIVNLTHHSYFNLDGHESDIKSQCLFVNSKKILETSSAAIPTSKFLKLADTPFDFGTPKSCPEKIDATFVIDQENKIAASLFSAKNNLRMDVYTDQPAVHVYVGGNCFGKIPGKENAVYHNLSGICFETQHYPDAPNHPEFPSTVLKKDGTYRQKTKYHFEII